MTAIREAEFQEQVIQLAHTLGWRHLHVRRSIGKGKQWVTATNVPWPDLTLWRPDERRPGFLIRELKVGDITKDATWQPGQREVLAELRAAGVDAGVWTPADFDLGIIQHELRGAA